jgi:hypothetical protein
LVVSWRQIAMGVYIGTDHLRGLALPLALTSSTEPDMVGPVR